MALLTARDVMNRPVLTIRDDRTVEEAAAFLVDHSISGAPVVDRNRKLVGVVTLTDIAEHSRRRDPDGYARAEEPPISSGPRRAAPTPPGAKVKDIMMPTVFTIPEATTVPEIAQTMIAGRIHRLLVTHASQVVGIVTTLDLLRLLCKKPRQARLRRPAVHAPAP